MKLFKKREKPAAAEAEQQDQGNVSSEVQTHSDEGVDISRFISPEAAAVAQKEKEVQEAKDKRDQEKQEAKELEAEEFERRKQNTPAGFYNPLSQLSQTTTKKEGK